MNSIVAAILVFAAVLVAIDWRRGVPVAIVVGFIQDPLRKLDPAQSVYFTVLVMVFILLTAAGLVLRSVPGQWGSIFMMYRRLRTPFYFLVALVVAQAIRAVAVTGSPVVFAIGTMAYLAPAVTVMIGFYYGMYKGDVRPILVLYTILATVAAVTIMLEAGGIESKALGTVGVPLYIYGTTQVALYAGALRSPEVAAWHCAMGAMLALVLYVSSRRRAIDYGWLVIAAVCVVAILLTGRRKALFEIGVYLVAVSALAIYARRALPGAYVKAGIIGVVVAAVALLYLPVQEVFKDFDTISSRFIYQQESLIDRLWNMTAGSFEYVLDKHSVFGLGAGLGSQGAQYFGGIKTGYSAESGFAKVLAELGILGFVCLIMIGVRMSGYFASVIRYGQGNRRLEMILLGLTAIVFANVGNFLAAHQVYGDPFVISMLGLLVGFILAGPVLVWQQSGGVVQDGASGADLSARRSTTAYG